MSINGDWKVTMNSPMGAQDATLTLLAEGADLSGNIATFSRFTVRKRFLCCNSRKYHGMYLEEGLNVLPPSIHQSFTSSISHEYGLN